MICDTLVNRHDNITYFNLENEDALISKAAMYEKFFLKMKSLNLAAEN
jgi:hypothetical protein